ncbi:hypothetical protein ScPMuIL_014948 [Solemya velum]
MRKPVVLFVAFTVVALTMVDAGRHLSHYSCYQKYKKCILGSKIVRHFIVCQTMFLHCSIKVSNFFDNQKKPNLP